VNNGRASFAVSDNGVLVYRGGQLARPHQLAWYDRQGKRRSPIGNRGEYWTVALSPDQRRAAVVVGAAGARDTWIMDLSSGVLTRLTMDSKSSYYMGPWSPDSQRLAVNRYLIGGITELTVASGKSRVLVPDALYAEDWSPDSNFLLCVDTGSHRLFSVALDGSKPRSILDTDYRKREFRFAPDGRSVAYSSEESGQFEIFVASFPSFAEKRQISSGGGTTPFWRKDGREIFYVSAERRLMSADISAGPTIEVGIPKPLFELPPRDLDVGVGIAPAGDGKKFLAVESGPENKQEQIMVVLNWAAGQEK
jgi:Tol biopolymer transport system component